MYSVQVKDTDEIIVLCSSKKDADGIASTKLDGVEYVVKKLDDGPHD
jgi:hypothetical protein